MTASPYKIPSVSAWIARSIKALPKILLLAGIPIIFVPLGVLLSIVLSMISQRLVAQLVAGWDFDLFYLIIGAALILPFAIRRGEPKTDSVFRQCCRVVVFLIALYGAACLALALLNDLGNYGDPPNGGSWG